MPVSTCSKVTTWEYNTGLHVGTPCKWHFIGEYNYWLACWQTSQLAFHLRMQWLPCMLAPLASGILLDNALRPCMLAPLASGVFNCQNGDGAHAKNKKQLLPDLTGGLPSLFGGLLARRSSALGVGEPTCCLGPGLALLCLDVGLELELGLPGGGVTFPALRHSPEVLLTRWGKVLGTEVWVCSGSSLQYMASTRKDFAATDIAQCNGRAEGNENKSNKGVTVCANQEQNCQNNTRNAGQCTQSWLYITEKSCTC